MNTEQDAGTRKGRGRPKTFDRDAALDKALELFWRHGYEGTSLSDLVEATGAKAPTLYAEFTNKEGMFRAAVDRYTEKFASQSEAALVCPETSVAGGIEKYFRSTAACFTDGKKPGGASLSALPARCPPTLRKSPKCCAIVTAIRNSIC